MIQEIIATVLFSSAIGTNIIQPKKESNSVYYSLRGSWCYVDAVLDFFGDETDFTTDETIVYYDYQSYNENIYAPKIYYASNSYYIDARTIDIVYNYRFNSSLSIYQLNARIHFGLGEDYIMDNVQLYTDFSDVSYDLRRIVVYFPHEIYVTKNAYNVWCSFFTQKGNNFVTMYNGYYTQSNFDIDNDYSVYGSMFINNNLYNEYSVFDNSSWGELNDDYRTYIVNNGMLEGDNRILFNNVLIPIEIYDYMSVNGVFAYTYEPVNYTFGELIFNIIDAPIYMLSQLFSFTLFGIEFYIAFIGIVTIILICFIVRKIV